jgi:hypothetical protein
VIDEDYADVNVQMIKSRDETEGLTAAQGLCSWEWI